MVKKPVDRDGIRQRPLEPLENAQVRDTLDERSFRKKVWKNTRIVVAWVAATGLGVIAFGKEIIQVLSDWLGGGGGGGGVIR